MRSTFWTFWIAQVHHTVKLRFFDVRSEYLTLKKLKLVWKWIWFMSKIRVFYLLNENNHTAHIDGSLTHRILRRPAELFDFFFTSIWNEYAACAAINYQIFSLRDFERTRAHTHTHKDTYTQSYWYYVKVNHMKEAHTHAHAQLCGEERNKKKGREMRTLFKFPLQNSLFLHIRFTIHV